MNIITIIKRLHRISLDDTDNIEELVTTAKKKLKLTIVLQLIIVTILGISIGLFIQSSVNFNTSEKNIYNEFGPQFTDKKVFMTVDIKTATIQEFKPGIIETDIGSVEMDKRPKSTVLIVFTDLEGKLKPISDMEYSNEINAKTFEYVGSDYNPGSGVTLIKSEYDRIRYKDYLKLSSELSEIKIQCNIRFITMIAAITMTSIMLIILMALILGIKRIDTEHYIPSIALFGSKQASTRKSIKKQGIGSDISDKGQYKRDEEDAISSEGGQFTGKLNKR